MMSLYSSNTVDLNLVSNVIVIFRNYPEEVKEVISKGVLGTLKDRD
jgi:hypothetical protein